MRSLSSGRALLILTFDGLVLTVEASILENTGEVDDVPSSELPMPLAMDDRARILDFIEQDDPRAALAVVERIAKQVMSRGWASRARSRDTRTGPSPHAVHSAHRVEKDCVHILRILHSAHATVD
jgi:toxin ParE1/3/4